MLHLSTQKLIIKLCELTAEGEVQWREGADGSAVFETEGYAVEVASLPARLRVLTADGNELERVEAASLAAAPWPGGEGSFADHVSAMAAQAQRLARGTDHAISRILSSLSAPSIAQSASSPAAMNETLAANPPSPAGGAKSGAAIADAVADIAASLDQPRLADGEAFRSAPLDGGAASRAEGGSAPSPPPMMTTIEARSRTTPANVVHVRRSTEMFGRTRSFAIAGRTHPRQTPEARPISQLGKITASGLVMAGAPAAPPTPPETHPPETDPMEAHPTEPQTQVGALAPVRREDAPAAKPLPAPTPPEAYKPWV